jgi:hypothetical protein
MKAKKETKSPPPSSGQNLTSEADEDEDLEDEEADLDEDDFKSEDIISKQTTSAHIKHSNFSPMHILS